MEWTRQPQEVEGTYRFDGNFFVTRGVNEALPREEIEEIYRDVRQFAEEQDGIDYLQVYIHTDGRKLFFMDQLNDDMKSSGGYPSEYNYCTLMFPHER